MRGVPGYWLAGRGGYALPWGWYRGHPRPAATRRRWEPTWKVYRRLVVRCPFGLPRYDFWL